MNFQGFDMYTRLITGFGLLAAVVLFWGIGRFFFKIVLKLIRFSAFSGNEKVQLNTSYFAQSPEIALGQAKEEVVRMGLLALSSIDETAQLLITNLPKHAVKAMELKKAIHDISIKISDYLVALSNHSLTELDSKKHTILLETSQAIERIGEHVLNIVRLTEKYEDDTISASDKYLEEMITWTGKAFKHALQAFDYNDKTAAEKAKEIEKEIDKLEQQYQNQHIERLRKGVFSGHSGIIHSEMIRNIAQIGHHSSRIAGNVLE